MFSRQKRNYKIFIYAALTVAICVLIILLFWPKEPDKTVYSESATNEKIQNTDEYDDRNEYDNDDDIYEYDDDDEYTDEEAEEDEYMTNNTLETYYLIKRDAESIKVFFSDKYGDLIELEETQIIYDLLTEEDQLKFDEGLKAKTQEELASILMNYES